jgi:hypothetical protein
MLMLVLYVCTIRTICICLIDSGRSIEVVNEEEKEEKKNQDKKHQCELHLFSFSFLCTDRHRMVMYTWTKTDYCFSLDKLLLPVVVIVPIRLIDGSRSDIVCWLRKSMHSLMRLSNETDSSSLHSRTCQRLIIIDLRYLLFRNFFLNSHAE